MAGLGLDDANAANVNVASITTVLINANDAIWQCLAFHKLSQSAYDPASNLAARRFQAIKASANHQSLTACRKTKNYKEFELFARFSHPA